MVFDRNFFSGLVLYLLRNQSSRLLFALAIFLFFLGYMVQVSGNLHYLNTESDSLLNDYLLYRNFLFVCFPFLTIGFLINKHQIDISTYKNSSLLVILSILGVIAEAFLIIIISAAKVQIFYFL